MSSRRAASLLGPLIALLLIGGVAAVVLSGPEDPADTEFSQEPDQDSSPDAGFGDAEEDAADGAGDGVQEPAAEPTDTPAPETQLGAEGDAGVAGPGTPADTGGGGGVQDPTALTGGWEGGTPNTGTAVSAAGLLLLTIGGGLLWVRRART